MSQRSLGSGDQQELPSGSQGKAGGAAEQGAEGQEPEAAQEAGSPAPEGEVEGSKKRPRQQAATRQVINGEEYAHGGQLITCWPCMLRSPTEGAASRQQQDPAASTQPQSQLSYAELTEALTRGREREAQLERLLADREQQLTQRARELLLTPHACMRDLHPSLRTGSPGRTAMRACMVICDGWEARHANHVVLAPDRLGVPVRARHSMLHARWRRCHGADAVAHTQCLCHRRAAARPKQRAHGRPGAKAAVLQLGASTERLHCTDQPAFVRHHGWVDVHGAACMHAWHQQTVWDACALLAHVC